MKSYRHGCVLLALAMVGTAVPALATARALPLAAQEAELRAALAPTAAVVLPLDRALTVRLPIRLVFIPDENELLPAAKSALDLLARSLHRYRRTQIVVAVYTDAIGTEAFNQEQSKARAAVVAEYLKGKGVSAARLIVRGAGESAPLSQEQTAEGRDRNRRLEVSISALSS